MSTRKMFSLNGKEIHFKQGETIMDAALKSGEYIDHLCHHPEFEPHGSCRVCMVKLNGKFVSACTQPAEVNTQVISNSDEIIQQRRALLQMLFVEGNHVCPSCEKSGDCQLQALAYKNKMLSPHYSHFFPKRALDASHPDVIIDFNRCILCELCVRASLDVDQKNVFSVDGRGINAKLIINSPSGKLGDSDFSGKDKAAHICPVGAILPKHQGFKIPIGERQYDHQPISEVNKMIPTTPDNVQKDNAQKDDPQKDSAPKDNQQTDRMPKGDNHGR
jgi:[NiFe] hydrogenase diaphorase moiety small subunit